MTVTRTGVMDMIDTRIAHLAGHPRHHHWRVQGLATGEAAARQGKDLHLLADTSLIRISTRQGLKTRTEARQTSVAHLTQISRCRCMEVTDRGSVTLSRVIQAWLTLDLGIIVHIK